MHTTTQLSENSHQGFEGIKAALCLAAMEAKPNVASGMRPCLRRNGAGSRCSGKERDSESGLDYFGARYFSGAQGRFTSADSTAYSKLGNPQSWNLYAYSFNNPLRFIDPTGNEVQAANCGTEEECKKVLGAVRGALGNQQAAGRIGIERIQRGFLGRLLAKATGAADFRFTISGDLDNFRALGQNANRFADLVTSSKVVTAAVSDKYTPFAGAEWTTPGGIAQTPSRGFDLSRVTVANNPGLLDQDTTGLIAGGIGNIPGVNLGEAMAHELIGHAWSELIAGRNVGTPGNMRDALQAENAVRATDPSRGLKMTHHKIPVFTRQELEKLFKKQ